MFGFKYADDYVFKINKEREQEAIAKAAGERTSSAPVQDFGALRMQVNFELMHAKINIESMVKKQFALMREAHDNMEEKFEIRHTKAEEEITKIDKNVQIVTAGV